MAILGAKHEMIRFQSCSLVVLVAAPAAATALHQPAATAAVLRRLLHVDLGDLASRRERGHLRACCDIQQWTKTGEINISRDVNSVYNCLDL